MDEGGEMNTSETLSPISDRTARREFRDCTAPKDLRIPVCASLGRALTDTEIQSAIVTECEREYTYLIDTVHGATK